MFEVYFENNRAKKDYENLEGKERDKINEFCEVVKQTPVPFRIYDIKKIEGRKDCFRVR